jgi:hypothetical protein
MNEHVHMPINLAIDINEHDAVEQYLPIIYVVILFCHLPSLLLALLVPSPNLVVSSAYLCPSIKVGARSTFSNPAT